jgi:hypothetical protein
MPRSEASLRGIFWAGLLGGVVSALPLVNLANCFCCMWAWLTGAAAVALVRQREPLIDSDAPKVGALAGAYAGLVMVTLNLLGQLAGFGGGFDVGSLGEFFPESMPADSLEWVGTVSSSGPVQIVFALVGGVITAGLYAAFGALGAMLYVRFKRPAGQLPAPPATGPDPEGESPAEHDSPDIGPGGSS